MQGCTRSRLDKIIEDLELSEIKRVWDKLQAKQRQFESEYTDEYGLFNEELYFLHQSIKEAEAEDERKQKRKKLYMKSTDHTEEQRVAATTQVNEFFSINAADFPELAIDPPLSVRLASIVVIMSLPQHLTYNDMNSMHHHSWP